MVDFDLRQLEVFVKVVELGSVSKAADAVKLTQSSVSERMSTLEKTVGIQLFDRVGRNIRPSQAGRLLYKHAKKHMQLKEQTCQSMMEFMGIMRGEMHIHSSTIPGEYILPTKIKQFRDDYPEISVKLTISGSSDVAERVLGGHAPLGFVGIEKNIPELEYQRIWDDELVLVVPADHPWANQKIIELTELVDAAFVLRESGSATRSFMEDSLTKANGHPANLKIVAELGNSTAVKTALLNGMGVTIISKRAVEHEVKLNLLSVVEIKGLSMPRSFYLITDKRRSLSPVDKAFVKFILRDNE